jgi:hypothetical protein
VPSASWYKTTLVLGTPSSCMFSNMRTAVNGERLPQGTPVSSRRMDRQAQLRPPPHPVPLTAPTTSHAARASGWDRRERRARINGPPEFLSTFDPTIRPSHPARADGVRGSRRVGAQAPSATSRRGRVLVFRSIHPGFPRPAPCLPG